VQRQSEEAA
jgi:hypothetical protein